MATQIFGRLFPKTLTSLTSFRSLSTHGTALSPSLVERNSSVLKLRNGYDYYRNFVFMQKYEIGPFGDFRFEPTRVELINDYVKILANLVGSEEEARMMVYSDYIGEHYHLFGTLLSDELYRRVEVLPRVSDIICHDVPLRGKRSFRVSSSPNKG